LRAGVSTRLAPLPAWKQDADQLFVQVSFSLDALLRWRDTVTFDGPVYAGVMVLASAGMARKLVHDIPEIDVPAAQLDALDRDAGAGVELACEHVLRLRDSGAVDGVHLVPVSRYREVAARLEREL
jgi:5,10-methylenetetrahydrofolate reductase